MFNRLATLVERLSGPIVLAWVGAAIALSIVAPSLQEVGTQDDTAFLPASAPSQRADRLLRELFPDDPSRDSAVVVFARDGGLTDADRAAVADMVAFLGSETMSGAIQQVQSTATDPALAPLLRSEDGEAELVMVGFSSAPFTDRTNAAVRELREHLRSVAPSGLQHHVTGVAGLAHDQGEALIASFDRTAVVTLLLVVTILVLVYRSAVAPLIPLASIVLSFLVARGVVALMAEGGFEVASLADTFMVVMIFGAGTDYCLFIVSRYREDLQAGRPVPATVRRTMTVIGAVIAASASTVIVGFLSQLSADFGMYRTMGPAMGVAIFVTLLAGLTFTPALIRLTGRHAFWPASLARVRRLGDDHSPRWDSLADTIRRRPAETLLAGVIGLVFAAGGLGWYAQSFDLVSELPASADARQGFEALSRHYPGGTLAPVFLTVRTEGPIVANGRLEAIDELTDRLRRHAGIAEVRSVTQPVGAPLTTETVARFGTGGPEGFGLDPNTIDLTPLFSAMSSPEGLRFTTPVLERYPQLTERLGFFLGADGSSTRLVVAMEGNPYSVEALETFRTIDDLAARTLAEAGLDRAELALGGPPSFYADMHDIGNRDFRVIAAVVIGAIFVVLAVLLRSIVTPFYLLATVLLSYAATMGLTAGLFVGILGEPGLAFWLPSFLFVILVALGADYNIFIISRIREEAAAGVPIKEAAARGLVLTGHVITSAGLILAGTFAALMLAPMPSLRQIGFAVTVGVLLDTFVVRPLLVPSATVLLGRWAFWPAALGREPRPAVAPRHVGAATAGIGALAVALVALVATSGAAAPITRIESSVPTAVDEQAGSRGQPASATPAASAATEPRPSEPSGTEVLPTPASTSPPMSRQPPAPDAAAGPRRIAVPSAGTWTYRLEGTRRIGAAGTTQPFGEDATTEVTRVGGSDEAPEIQLYTRSESGTQEDRRRYAPSVVELLSTRLSGAATSFGGTFHPPQALVRQPLQQGDTWTSEWTTGGTNGRTTTTVVGQRRVQTPAGAFICWDVRSDTTFTGEARGEQHETACWVPDLGMSVDDERQFSGTYNGIPFDIRTHATLVARP